LITGLHGDADAAHQAIARWADDPRIEPEAATQCALYRAQLARSRGEAQAALQHALHAKGLLQRAAQPAAALQASVHGELGYGYAVAGRAAEAEREYAQALAIFRSSGRTDSAAVVALLNNWSLLAWNAGDIRRSLEMLNEAIALASRRGAAGDVPTYALANRAAALLALGRNDEALRAARDADEVARRAGDRRFRYMAACLEAGALAELGDLAGGDEALRRARGLTQTLPEGSFDPNYLALFGAMLELRRGRPLAARDMVEPRIEQLRARGERSGGLASLLRVRAEALLALGEHAAAQRDAGVALDIWQRQQQGRPHSLRTGQLWLLLARIRHAGADVDGARDAARRAAEHLDAMLDGGHPDRELAHRLSAN
jgi:tetratricopeptide (TPR) repeat protein